MKMKMNSKEKVQQLIDDYKQSQILKYRAEESEKAALAAIKKHCERLPNFAGIEETAITLNGVDTRMKIRPRENVTYKKERGEIHPLEKLQSQFPDLASMVRIGYSESGSKIKNLVAKFLQNDDALSSTDVALAESILRFRQTKNGKPTIELAALEQIEYEANQ